MSIADTFGAAIDVLMLILLLVSVGVLLAAGPVPATVRDLNRAHGTPWRWWPLKLFDEPAVPQKRAFEEEPYTITTQTWPEGPGNPYLLPDAPREHLIWCGARDEDGRQVLVEHPWYAWEDARCT